ncbi:MAG: hypothetical protein KF684_00610 [Phycisphaeraceae bacterium]|nr:hypothetical protein [Phycisphaeraceae bacterium]
MSKFIAASAGLALAAMAMADGNNQTIGGGAGFAIPDNVPAGASSSINTNVGSPFTVVGVQFTGLSHTWVGDLIMTLSGPGGAGNSFNFFYRPGQTTPTAVGQNGDFLAGNSYSFVDGGLAWNTGAVIPSGAYAPIRSPFAPAQSINSFAGLNGVDGTWTLNISDNAGLDTGSFQGWALIVKPIPTPGAAALLGVAGLAGLRRRR